MATGDNISLKLPKYLVIGRPNTRNRMRALSGPLPRRPKQNNERSHADVLWETIKIDIELACHEITRRNRYEDYNAYGGRYWACVSSLAGCMKSDLERFRRERGDDLTKSQT